LSLLFEPIPTHLKRYRDRQTKFSGWKILENTTAALITEEAAISKPPQKQSRKKTV
jgi:hypothetical protein